MNNRTLVAATAIFACLGVPSLAKAASCALYDPGCQTYQLPSNSGTGGAAATRNEVRTSAGLHQRNYGYQVRAVRREAVHEDRTYRGDYRPDRSGNVLGATVGTAGAVAAGAINTAGAIATAPFRAADSYAYYDDGYNGWAPGWQGQTYAERNGFVCTPGTYFRGFDQRMHICQ